ncbi:monocarboxylate transporter 12-like [Amphiura filiformis]|uniref:monocarboxylate transporter 12-like n=1 Tax=Amphiura filiformis TaxID=82378 RepID=UPI003B2177B6
MKEVMDRGWSCVVLFGVFVTISLSFGFLQCIGVLYVDWQEDFDTSAQAVSWSSALSIGGYGISGLVSSVISLYVSCRWQAFFGGLLASISLTCSPWITRIIHLNIIMAVMGFGTGFVYTSGIVVLGYYFDKKLALATGIGVTGGGAGMFLAPLIRYLNDEYSWRGAMLIIGGMLGNICAVSTLYRMSHAEMINMAKIRPDVKGIPVKTKNKNSENDNNPDIKMGKSQLMLVRHPGTQNGKNLLLLGIAGLTCLLGSLAKSYVALAIFAVVLGFTQSTQYALFTLLLREVVGVNYFKKIFGIATLLLEGTALIALPFMDWQEDFDTSAQAVGWSSAVSIGGYGISGLVSSVISPYVSCRWQAFFGGLVASISLTCSICITHIIHLYIIMAVMGLGIGLAFTSSIVVLGYYFDKKLALATGLGFSGSGAGLLILAPLIQYLNEEYSWRGVMLICGGMLGNICVSTALYRMSQAERVSMTGIRPDVKDTPLKTRKGNKGKEQNIDFESRIINFDSLPSRSSKQRQYVAKNVIRHSKAFVKSYTDVLSIRFVMICIVSSVLSGFGYFTALMYFVSNAINLGIPKTDAAFLLSIFGISGITGRLVYGPIIDKKIISPFYLGSLLLGTAGSSCFLGTLVRSYEALVIFSIVLGFSASTYNVLYPLLFREVIGVKYFKKIFGIGVILWDATSVVALPLMGYAYDVTGDYRVSFYAAGSAMLLNSIITVMDHVWVELDRRWQRPVLSFLVY